MTLRAHAPATYPHQVRVDFLGTPLAQVGFTNMLQNNAYWFAGAVDNGAGAQNSYIEYEVPLAPGTWTIDLFHRTGPNRGIYTLSLDGTNVGTVDGYNASALNQRTSVAGVTVAAGGVKALRVTMATKNASSTAYVGLLSAVVLIRTA